MSRFSLIVLKQQAVSADGDVDWDISKYWYQDSRSSMTETSSCLFWQPTWGSEASGSRWHTEKKWQRWKKKEIMNLKKKELCKSARGQRVKKRLFKIWKGENFFSQLWHPLKVWKRERCASSSSASVFWSMLVRFGAFIHFSGKKKVPHSNRERSRSPPASAAIGYFCERSERLGPSAPEISFPGSNCAVQMETTN